MNQMTLPCQPPIGERHTCPAPGCNPRTHPTYPRKTAMPILPTNRTVASRLANDDTTDSSAIIAPGLQLASYRSFTAARYRQLPPPNRKMNHRRATELAIGVRQKGARQIAAGARICHAGRLPAG